MHIEKRDVWKSLRAMLQTMRRRLPVDLAVHFGARIADAGAWPLLRRLRIVASADQNVARRFFRGDAVTNHCRPRHRSSRNCAERCGSSREPHWRRQNAEVMDAFPRDMEALLPALASAA